ncbi:hypothetical protein [Nonomuraea turcica]|uniref:hypothetical protein n=1 Tax=Nonomuraea sp. G32 TaxID=3067274 RepID=UPI00273B9FB1|nr:hypothetical protein [Nonomuraea sp. G32]MDP4511969.1 hypothetical protein [Nonomuraea sp. G32]
MWGLIAAAETGFPWLRVAGKVLTGWIVIYVDATLITDPSDEQGTSATFIPHRRFRHSLTLVNTICH